MPFTSAGERDLGPPEPRTHGGVAAFIYGAFYVFQTNLHVHCLHLLITKFTELFLRVECFAHQTCKLAEGLERLSMSAQKSS